MSGDPLLTTVLPSPRSESHFSPDSVEGYAHLLRQVLLDGIVSPGEKRLIEEHRQQNKISFDMHKKGLEHIGWTLENWDAAVEMGKETLPDEIYGGAGGEVYYIPKLHEKNKPIYFHGLVVAPHLRQWYILSDSGVIEKFWREKEERKASPLELFLDLCFVTTIYQLSSAIEEKPFSVLVYIILYCSFWRVWGGITNYSTRYEHEDWLHPLAYCTTMLGALYMTSEIHDIYSILSGHIENPSAYRAEILGFAAAFIFASFPLFVLYILATITELSGNGKFIFSENNRNLARKTTYHPLQMLIVLTISFIPWLFTVFSKVDNPAPYWGGSLLFMEIATHTIDFINHWSAPICLEHWGERISLFVMLHLGESMFSIASNHGGTNEVSIISFVATLFALIIPFAFRRVYFEVEGREPKKPHAVRNRITFHLYIFSHLVLCMSIIAYAIGFSGLQTVTNVEIDGKDLQIPYYTQLDKQGLLKPYNNFPETGDTNTTTTNETNLTCSEELTDLQLYYIFREDQSLFCVALALMMLMVAVQTLLSKTSEEYEKDYYLNNSQYWRVGTRFLFSFFLLILPTISKATITVSAFGTVCICGSFYFVWALVESFFVLRKGAHKHLLGHHPHYMEMSSFDDKPIMLDE